MSKAWPSSFSRSQILALSLPFVSVGAPVGNAKEALGTSYAFSLLGLGSSLGLSRWLVAYLRSRYEVRDSILGDPVLVPLSMLQLIDKLREDKTFVLR